jgi:hypothetical protein
MEGKFVSIFLAASFDSQPFEVPKRRIKIFLPPIASGVPPNGTDKI